MGKRKSNINETSLSGHRYAKKLTNPDYGTLAFLIDKRDILKDKKENSKSFQNKELSHNCLYFLIGYEIDEDKNIIEKMYVGQAGIRDNGESVLDRLNEHIYSNRDSLKYRDKWTDIVIVTNRDKDAWGATELNALEHIFWSLIPVGSRFNSVKPASTGADLEIFADAVNQIKDYLSYLGYETFKNKTSEDIVHSIEQIVKAKSDMPVDLDLGKTRVPNITTPHKAVKEIVDTLPSDIWNDKTVFLDPACKGGEFLLEIYNRLMKSEQLISKYPNEISRSTHIILNQLYGVSLSKVSYEKTKDTLFGCDNNIKLIPDLKEITSKLSNEALKEYINKEFNKEMKIDVVIGNPPYQEMTYSGLNESGGTSIFDSFINIGLDITDRIVCMITPTKWISGESKNFTKLRSKITEGNHIIRMVDYMNSRDVFNNVSIAGGVSYFVYDKEYSGKTEFTTVLGNAYTHYRDLGKGDIIPRHSVGEYIINKIKETDNDFLYSHIYKNKYNLGTDFSSGEDIKLDDTIEYTKVITPRGEKYIDKTDYVLGNVTDYKVMFTRVVSEHAVESDKNNKYTLLSSLRVLGPNEICNASYMIVGGISKKEYAENIKEYLETKFVRFLILQTLFGIGLTPNRFQFVPMQDFSKKWTDKELYEKYQLTQDEISFIEKVIK